MNLPLSGSPALCACAAPARILHVIGKMDRAGAETLIVNVLRCLDPSCYGFDFLVRCKEPGHYDDELLRRGCRIFRRSHRPDFPGWITTVHGILRSQGPYRAVHSHLNYFDGVTVALARLAGVPVRISHAHSGSDRTEPSPLRWAWQRACEPAFVTRPRTGLVFRRQPTHLCSANDAGTRPPA